MAIATFALGAIAPAVKHRCVIIKMAISSKIKSPELGSVPPCLSVQSKAKAITVLAARYWLLSLANKLTGYTLTFEISSKANIKACVPFLP